MSDVTTPATKCDRCGYRRNICVCAVIDQDLPRLRKKYDEVSAKPGPTEFRPPQHWTCQICDIGHPVDEACKQATIV